MPLVLWSRNGQPRQSNIFHSDIPKGEAFVFGNTSLARLHKRNPQSKTILFYDIACQVTPHLRRWHPQLAPKISVFQFSIRFAIIQNVRYAWNLRQTLYISTSSTHILAGGVFTTEHMGSWHYWWGMYRTALEPAGSIHGWVNGLQTWCAMRASNLPWEGHTIVLGAKNHRDWITLKVADENRKMVQKLPVRMAMSWQEILRIVAYKGDLNMRILFDMLVEMISLTYNSVF